MESAAWILVSKFSNPLNKHMAIKKCAWCVAWEVGRGKDIEYEIGGIVWACEWHFKHPYEIRLLGAYGEESPYIKPGEGSDGN